MKKVILAVMATAALASTQTLAAGDAGAGKAKFGMCVTCHGAAGEGGVGPKLAGQATGDIVSKLNDYKAGKQRGPMTSMMAPMAAGLSDADVQNVAAYVATL